MQANTQKTRRGAGARRVWRRDQSRISTPSLNLRLPRIFLRKRSTSSAAKGCAPRLEGQAERHALFAGAEFIAAVDVEQLDVGQLLAGVAHLVHQRAALGFLGHDERQVALDGRQLGDGHIAQRFGRAGVEVRPVDLAQVDVLAAAAVLGQLELCRDVVGQLAEHADARAAAQDVRRDAGVQPGQIRRALHRQRDAELGAQRFDRALDGEEVSPSPQAAKPRCRRSSGSSVTGCCLGR